MKFEALRRALVRLIAPAKAEVPPKSPVLFEGNIDEFFDALRSFNLDVAERGTSLPSERLHHAAIMDEQWTPHRPLPPADMIPWADWKKCAMAMARPGWSFCKFGYHEQDRGMAGQVMGIVRGSFGIFERPWPVCHERHDGDEAAGETILASICHLPTGMGMGLFMTRNAAAVAAEIMQGMSGIDWETLDLNDPSQYGDTEHRVGTAWKAVGITTAPMHAHHYHTGQPMPVWLMTNASQIAGKPEKLS